MRPASCLAAVLLRSPSLPSNHKQPPAFPPVSPRRRCVLVGLLCPPPSLLSPSPPPVEILLHSSRRC